MFDQTVITKDITHYCRHVFSDENLGYSDADIERGIKIFFHIVRTRIGLPKLDGFRDAMEKDLTLTCVTEPGQFNPLESLLSRLDTYMKRILWFEGRLDYGSYENKAFKDLVRLLNVFPSIDNYTSSGESWKNDSSGRYILYRAVTPRNLATHNTPDWDKAEVMTHLKYILAAYILITLKLEGALATSHPEIYDEPEKIIEPSDEDLQAYDFLDYSKVSRDLKKQVIECFIMRTLYNEGEMSEEDMKAKVQEFINKETKDVTHSCLTKLVKTGFLIPAGDNKFSLTPKAVDKLTSAKTNCTVNKQNFLDDLGAILENTPLQEKIEEVYTIFSGFLEKRYRDTARASFDEDESEIDDAEGNPFYSFLRSNLDSDESAKDIYRKIVNLCNENDIVYRLSIGKVISRITDSSPESLMMQRKNRSVYLDTQVVLPMLCMPYSDLLPGEKPIFRNARNLMKIGSQPNVTFKICKTYISEVKSHIRKAIEMVWLEENPVFLSGQFSQNVFYHYYINACKEGTLPEDITSFEDYLCSIFDIDPDDIGTQEIKRYYQYSLDSVIEKHLKDPLAITIDKDIPFYSDEDLKMSETVFSDVIKKLNTNKSPGTLRRDSIVGKYLFDLKESPKPIFITRDNSFTEYRKTYAKYSKDNNGYFWHLFSPVKFVTNHDLMGMKINPDLLSEDLLLMIEDEDTVRSAGVFIEVNARLTDIEGISEAEKRKRQKENFKLFSGKEFADLGENDLESINELATSINRTWDEVMDHFLEIQLKDTFMTALKNDLSYEKVMQVIKDYIDSDLGSMKDLFLKIEDTFTITPNDAPSGVLRANE
ncbi:MAG: hypothetical protein K2G67_00010 [Muribaculaceae bacterium]|nr:hypothetical protein [Muribaculaceae bacterium]